MCIYMYIDMYVDIPVDMCVDMCVDMYTLQDYLESAPSPTTRPMARSCSFSRCA